MGEPNQVAEQLGELNIAPAPQGANSFWKTWTEVEKKAPNEMKNAQFVRVSVSFARLVACNLGRVRDWVLLAFCIDCAGDSEGRRNPFIINTGSGRKVFAQFQCINYCSTIY
eukprot:g49357.t1